MKTFMLASALTMLLPLISATDWAISAFTANDCDVRTILYAEEEDNAGSFQCHPFSGTAHSVNWNGNGFWCVDLHQDADCQGSGPHLKSGVSGCQASDAGWQSFSLSIPDAGYPC